MLCLTLRSGRDGRLLARVVETGGRPFVLDFGDRRVISDLVQRIAHGFSVIRGDRLVQVPPDAADMVEQLATFYAAEGVLVFLEEPTWPGRRPTEPLPLAELDEDDDPTDMVSLRDLPAVDEALTTLLPEHELEEDPTEVAPRLAPVEDVPEETVEVGLLPGAPSAPPDDP